METQQFIPVRKNNKTKTAKIYTVYVTFAVIACYVESAAK